MSEEQPELPFLPYDDRRTGKSSGWSGSDTSQERAEHDDTAGVTLKRQRIVLTMLEGHCERGLTWKELATLTDWHHGQASSVLSNLHAAGLVARLAEKRVKCHPYVLPECVGDRETQPFGGKGKRPSLGDVWDEGFHAGQQYVGHGSPEPENPYR